MTVRLRYRRWWGRQVRRLRAYADSVATVGPGDDVAQRFAFFGPGAGLMAPQGVIFNEEHIAIGADTLVGPHVCLTAGMAPGQEMLHSPVVRIGERTRIGRYGHIIGHWSIDIGNDVDIAPHVYITDQNHGYADPDAPVGTQLPTVDGVEIGDGSWVGTHVVILPGTRLGPHTVVAAGAVVRGTFPGHVVIGGVPATILRQWDAERGWVSRGARG